MLNPATALQAAATSGVALGALLVVLHPGLGLLLLTVATLSVLSRSATLASGGALGVISLATFLPNAWTRAAPSLLLAFLFLLTGLRQRGNPPLSFRWLSLKLGLVIVAHSIITFAYTQWPAEVAL